MIEDTPAASHVPLHGVSEWPMIQFVPNVSQIASTLYPVDLPPHGSQQALVTKMVLLGIQNRSKGPDFQRSDIDVAECVLDPGGIRQDVDQPLSAMQTSQR